LDVIQVFTGFWAIINPLLWIFIIINIIDTIATFMGLWGVFRLIPEWMGAYGMRRLYSISSP
jgi:phage-related protein